MRILSLKVSNYRTLEDVNLHFPSYYSSICGKNDSGKTNIVNVIRGLLVEEQPYYFEEYPRFSIKKDFPKWKEVKSNDKKINITIEIKINKLSDTGLYEFLNKFLKLNSKEEDIVLEVEYTLTTKSPPTYVNVTVGKRKYEGFDAQEVLKKLQNSPIVLFHSSSGVGGPFPFLKSQRGFIQDISHEYRKDIEKMKAGVNKTLGKIAKKQQREIKELLNLLETKFDVGLTLPSFEFDYLQFDISLGDKKANMALDQWGSGTRNRTLILLHLLRAKQIVELDASSDKITPVLIIEEPENFLHPTAQAEFGRVLQELSEKFKVQVIVTSHSPYLLSMDKPESNILLERKMERRKLRNTIRADISGENWMKPFGLALGIGNEDFKSWRSIIFGHSDKILLVEGVTDIEYFEMLKDSSHGTNRLKFEGEIFSYGGYGNLKNSVLLKFIKDKYDKVFLTFDRDAYKELKKCLESLGMKNKIDYCAIGLSEEGKDDIEGLMPEIIKSTVYSNYSDLVTKSMKGSADSRKKAKNELKSKILEEFKDKANVANGDFNDFYPYTKLINKALM